MNGSPLIVADRIAEESAFQRAELDTLREFYRAWEALHELPKDKLHRKQCEEAAQALVSHAHILRRMYVTETAH